MSWHDSDDDVENDSVGWFNARDYQDDRRPEPQPQEGSPYYQPAPPRPRFSKGRG